MDLEIGAGGLSAIREHCGRCRKTVRRRDIAKVLGFASAAKASCTVTAMSSPGRLAIWCDWPTAEIDPAWKRWRRELLPLLPERWPLVVGEPTREQFEVVRRILPTTKPSSG